MKQNKSFVLIIEKDLEKKILKLKKKDKALYTVLYKKIIQIVENPYIGKPLRNVLKNKRRVHVGSFVLIYEINEKEKKIVLLKFEHHDKVYK